MEIIRRAQAEVLGVEIPREAPTMEAILEWARAMGLTLVGGTRAEGASLYFTFKDEAGETRRPFYIYHDSQTLLHIQFAEISDVLDTTEKRRAFANELRNQTDIELDLEKSYPSIRLGEIQS